MVNKKNIRKNKLNVVDTVENRIGMESDIDLVYFSNYLAIVENKIILQKYFI